MKTKNIIWGLILVLIGVLFILKNLDIIYFSWYSLWKLWPLLLVMIGVTILPVKDGIKVVLAIIVLIAAAFFLVSYPDFHNRNNDMSVNNSQDNNQVTRIPGKLTNGSLKLMTALLPKQISHLMLLPAISRLTSRLMSLFEFEKDGNLGRYTYSIKDLGTKREISIELEEGRIIRTDLKNKVSIKLNPNPAWDIKVDVGAANIELDLSSFKIRKLDIDGGASSINHSFGHPSGRKQNKNQFRRFIHHY